MSLYVRALKQYGKGNVVNALKIINESELSGEWSKKYEVDIMQGSIFKDLSELPENPFTKLTYLMAFVECFTRSNSYESAEPLYKIAELLGSKSYFKKCVATARVGLQEIASKVPEESDESDGVYVQFREVKEELEELIEKAESRIANPKALVPFPASNCEQELWVSDKYEELRKKYSGIVEKLRPHWEGSNAETKRSFMKVSVEDLASFALLVFSELSEKREDGTLEKNGKDALNQVLSHAKKNRKWVFWLCRTCCKKFSTSEEYESHLGEVHAAGFKPPSRNDMAQKVSQVWADKISVGVWKPVDATAAIEMIKKDMTAFKYEDGWCNEWPVAEDENRSKVLNDIRSLLVSLCDHQILSQRIRDRMMDVVVEKLGLSKQVLTHCGLLETPKSICFLKCDELNQIFNLLRKIKCTRRDGIDQVCRSVDSFCGGFRVKEKMDFDSDFSFLLLDKRLLQGNVDDRFDDEGEIRFMDPNVHCENVIPGEDVFLSWLAVLPSGDERLIFPRPIKAHNLDIWGAALRVFQFIYRTLGTKHAKKMQLLGYGAALNDAKELCIRMSPQESPENTYATLLLSKCREKDPESFFVRAVRDMLKGGLSKPSNEEMMGLIGSRESAVINKLVQLDSKMLLIENSRVKLLESLTCLSFFDYRSYIYPPLKCHLLVQLAKRFNIAIE